MRPLLRLALVPLAVLLWSAPGTALAHSRPERAAPPTAASPAVLAPALGDGPALVAADAPAAGALLPVALALLAAAAAGACRPRHALRVALVLLLASFAFDGALHSVHHLDDEAAAARCAVASVGAQLGGVSVATPTLEPVPAAAGLVALADSSLPAARLSRPDEGRGPPAA
jgi:hypothetical protein